MKQIQYVKTYTMVVMDIHKLINDETNLESNHSNSPKFPTLGKLHAIYFSYSATVLKEASYIILSWVEWNASNVNLRRNITIVLTVNHQTNRKHQNPKKNT